MLVLDVTARLNCQDKAGCLESWCYMICLALYTDQDREMLTWMVRSSSRLEEEVVFKLLDEWKVDDDGFLFVQKNLMELCNKTVEKLLIDSILTLYSGFSL